MLNDFITDTSTDEKSITSLILSSEIMKKNLRLPAVMNIYV